VHSYFPNALCIYIYTHTYTRAYNMCTMHMCCNTTNWLKHSLSFLQIFKNVYQFLCKSKIHLNYLYCLQREKFMNEKHVQEFIVDRFCICKSMAVLYALRIELYTTHKRYLINKHHESWLWIHQCFEKLVGNSLISRHKRKLSSRTGRPISRLI
jgi:hypothetical protein